MPLNGSDVASPVPGFDTVAANTTILSALHNSGIDDIFTILNSSRQFVHGALGGTSQITNWDNLTAKGTDIASASTIVLTTATGPHIDITGVTAITAVTLANGSMRIARATGIFTLTASATLLVNKSASVNYTTAVGDLMIFTAEGGVVSVTVIGSSTNPALTSNDPFYNFAINTPTVAASALTITFTGVDGNAISATNIAYINFRSATAGSGAIAQLALNSAQALVVPSGASLGSTNAIATTYALAAFNNAGAIVYGIINPLTLPLVDGIASTTLLSGTSTSAGVWYTTSALTSKAYTIIGYFTATEATAGTWATAPSAVQVATAPAANDAIAPAYTPIPTSSTYPIGTMMYLQNATGGSVTNNSTVAGSALIVPETGTSAGVGVFIVGSVAPTGTWRNISGRTVPAGTPGSVNGVIGYFVRTA